MFRTSNLRGNKSLSPGLPWVVMVPCWNISSIVVRTTLRWLEGRFYSSLHSWPQLRGCYQTLNLMCPYLNCYFFDFECDMREVASLFHNPNRIQTQEKKTKIKTEKSKSLKFLGDIDHFRAHFTVMIFTFLFSPYCSFYFCCSCTCMRIYDTMISEVSELSCSRARLIVLLLVTY